MTLEHRWIQERVVNFVQKKKRKRKKDPGELFKSTPHLCKFSSLGSFLSLQINFSSIKITSEEIDFQVDQIVQWNELKGRVVEITQAAQKKEFLKLRVV